MPLRPGQSFAAWFSTSSPTSGAAVNADSLPTAVLAHNGSIDGTVTLTVANSAAGLYTASGTIPSTYGAGDQVAVIVTATVGAITGKGVVASYTIDPQTPAGMVAVTQDYNGAGSMTVEDQSNGQPISGATVTAYLASAYSANPATAAAQAQALTDANGQWTLWLDPGASYTLVFSDAGYTGVDDVVPTATVTT